MIVVVTLTCGRIITGTWVTTGTPVTITMVASCVGSMVAVFVLVGPVVVLIVTVVTVLGWVFVMVMVMVYVDTLVVPELPVVSVVVG